MLLQRAAAAAAAAAAVALVLLAVGLLLLPALLQAWLPLPEQQAQPAAPWAPLLAAAPLLLLLRGS